MKKNTVIVEKVTMRNGKEYGIVKVQKDAIEYLSTKGSVKPISMRGNNLYLDFNGRQVIIPAEIANGKKYVNLIMNW